MGLLNSKHSNFVLNFPKNWFYPEIVDKYNVFFQMPSMPYKTIESFMSFSIQSISWPTITAINVEQYKKEGKLMWKGGNNTIFNIAKEFTITFRSCHNIGPYYECLRIWCFSYSIFKNNYIYTLYFGGFFLVCFRYLFSRFSNFNSLLHAFL